MYNVSINVGNNCNKRVRVYHGTLQTCDMLHPKMHFGELERVRFEAVGIEFILLGLADGVRLQVQNTCVEFYRDYSELVRSSDSIELTSYTLHISMGDKDINLSYYPEDGQLVLNITSI